MKDDAAGAPRPTYYEDIEVGRVRRFGRYRVGQDEIIAYARQFDPQPFHLDPQAAKRSIFGGLIASGWHTGSMMMRMVAEEAQRTGEDLDGGVIAALGFDNLQWRVPVRPGDELGVRSTVIDKRPSRSKPDRGRIVFLQEVLNQHDEVVMHCDSLVIFRRRPDPGQGRP